METIVKKASAGRVADTKSFVLTTETPDHVGDIVVLNGVDTKSFLDNPVVLVSHDSTQWPIGVWRNLRIVGDAMLADLQLAAAGTSRMADLARGLVDQGILRAVSVGFRPIEAQPLKPKGMKFIKSVLLEASLVSVPMNPRSVMVSKSLNMSSEEINLFFDTGAKLGNAGIDDAEAEVKSDRYQAVRNRAVRNIIAANRILRSHCS
jgi:hypothetical protein